jgi:hypothetical protein
MSMLERFRAEANSSPAARRPFEDGERTIPDDPNALDGQQVVKLWNWLQGMFQYEKRRQGPNRMQMALDCDYYDGDQFTDEDIFELMERGQAPLVYNLTKRTVDWVIGTEKKTRFDFKVLGRTEDDVENARIKTDAMKYFQDVNRTQFVRSQAFRESAIAGVGWLEDGVRADSDEEPIYSRNETWWFTLHDSHAMHLDHTDARYHFRYRYVDADIAEAMFPKRAQFVKANAQNASIIDEKMLDDFYLGNRISGEDYHAGSFGRMNQSHYGFIDSSRERVKIYEAWFKMPVRESTFRSKSMPHLNGEKYDANNLGMRTAVLTGDATAIDRVNMRVFYMLYTDTGVLAYGRSPYRHNQFPFTPIWCYRRGRDNMPYGMIRNIRDPQDGFNRRMAKAIFALTAYRVTADSDAIDEKTMSWEELRIEAGRPDAMIIKRRGTSIDVAQDRELGEEHMKIAQTEASLIIDTSGVTSDNLGMDSNAQSGKAIIAKQTEGSAVTAEMFDNYRLGSQISGEKQLSLIEQFVSEEKIFRITDKKGRAQWRKVNEITIDPATGEPRVLNDLTATKADFVIDQQDFHATMRQAAAEVLGEVISKLGNLEPQMTLRLMRMMIDVSDWPNKDEMVAELDQITGYKDPAGAQTAEEKAEMERAMQEQAAAAQKQQQQADAAFQAELADKLSKAEKNKAEAQEALARAQQALAEAAKKTAEAQAVGTEGNPEAAAEMQAALDQAMKDAQAKDEEVRALQEQMRNLEADRSLDKYKIDKDFEAKVIGQQRDLEGKVRTAEISRPPVTGPSPEDQERQADAMQDNKMVLKALEKLGKGNEEISRVVADLVKRVESQEKDNGADAITKTLDKALGDLARALEGGKDKGKATEPPKIELKVEKGAIVVNNNMPAAKGRTIKLSPDGTSARSEPDK